MTLEALAGSLSVDFGDVAFVVLVGCAYLLWHQFVRYPRRTNELQPRAASPAQRCVAHSSQLTHRAHCAALLLCQVRYRLTRTLMYPFLSWQSPHAFKVATALVGGLSVYFLLGGLITECAPLRRVVGSVVGSVLG